MAYLYKNKLENTGRARNPYSPIGMIDAVVDRKSRGYAAWVQSALNQIMGTSLRVDGSMGPKTRSVIRSFQQERGLKVDGIVGPKTEAALRAAGAPPLPWEDRTTPVEPELGALVPSPPCAGLSGYKPRGLAEFEIWLNTCQVEGLRKGLIAIPGMSAICASLGVSCLALIQTLTLILTVIVLVHDFGGRRGVKIFYRRPGYYLPGFIPGGPGWFVAPGWPKFLASPYAIYPQ